MRLKRATEQRADRYGLALGLIVVTVISIPLAGVGRWARVVSVALAGFTLLFTLYTSRAKRGTLMVAIVVASVAVVTSIVAVAAGGERLAAGAPALLGALLAVVAPIAIVRHLLTHDTITRHTVAGALCIYLLVGLFYAFVYAVAGAIDPPLFVQEATDRTVDHVYFSYVTLTTTGYGDLTARSSTGRMLAISEALIGQLYLVSVVAVLVANIGWKRKDR